MPSRRVQLALCAGRCGMNKAAVYRHYNEAGELLYVGASVCPSCRFSIHRSQSDWGRDVTRIDIEWFETKDDALAAEAAQIRSLTPKFNRQDNPKRPRVKWSDTTGHLFVRRYLDRTGMSIVEFANAIGLPVGAARKYCERVSHPNTVRATLICHATRGYVPRESWQRPRAIKLREVTDEEAAENFAHAQNMMSIWSKREGFSENLKGTVLQAIKSAA